jgi:hypothetical protein
MPGLQDSFRANKPLLSTKAERDSGLWSKAPARTRPGRSSYLYANRESVMGYAEAYPERRACISTAHVECAVNQLIEWRMCKKQQMGWSRAQY